LVGAVLSIRVASATCHCSGCTGFGATPVSGAARCLVSGVPCMHTTRPVQPLPSGTEVPVGDLAPELLATPHSWALQSVAAAVPTCTSPASAVPPPGDRDRTSGWTGTSALHAHTRGLPTIGGAQVATLGAPAHTDSCDPAQHMDLGLDLESGLESPTGCSGAVLLALCRVSVCGACFPAPRSTGRRR
jgi:hypothetical protein